MFFHIIAFSEPEGMGHCPESGLVGESFPPAENRVRNSHLQGLQVDSIPGLYWYNIPTTHAGSNSKSLDLQSSRPQTINYFILSN